jgi:hypothetical protein
MPIKVRSLWKPEDDKKLKKLLAIKGYGIAQISLELNRSEKAVRRRCDRLNLSSSSTYSKKKSNKKSKVA